MIDKKFVSEVHNLAVEKGWWEDVDTTSPRQIASLLTNIHGEISEANEAVRKRNPPSEKITGFTNLEEELADAVIRILDTAEGLELRLLEAIFAKHEYNKSRGYRHGNKAL